MMSSEWHGSDTFTNTGTTFQKDLYYGIHSFYWKKENGVFTLHDVYDFINGEGYPSGIEQIAVNEMYLAQQAGELTPFLTEIILQY